MHNMVCMGSSSTIQFISVFIIFILVLFLTYITTKWLANFQKEKSTGENVKILETSRISQNKYIQIAQVGDKCFVYAVCKDSVTALGEVNRESLSFDSGEKESFSFKDFLNKAREDEKEKPNE